MNKVVIVDAIRTPIGKFMGSLSKIESHKLGGILIKEIVKRNNIKKVDEVIMGQIAMFEPRGNPAREALLYGKLDQSIPAFTVNKNCASSVKSVALAYAYIKAGFGDIYLAGGMENMSKLPYLLKGARTGYRMGDNTVSDSLTDLLEGMGLTAERVADRYNISKAEQDEFALRSQKLAKKAQDNNVFKNQIVPVNYKDIYLDYDEGVKETSLEKLMNLKPVFKKDGTVTAGNSSTINDAASVILLMSEKKAKELKLTPLAEVIGASSEGCDPDYMGLGPIYSTRKLLKELNMKIEDFDLIELNEAFSAQALAVIKDLNMKLDKVNVHGGAIALGHPTGATGSILITKIVHDLKLLNKKMGLVTLCIGGGMGMSMAIKKYEEEK